MSDVVIEGRSRDNAVLLLAAAKDLDLDPSVAVRTTTNGYLVPEEVANQAGLGEEKPKAEASEAPAKKAPAKKAAAKKTAAKKTAAKKTASKE